MLWTLLAHWAGAACELPLDVAPVARHVRVPEAMVEVVLTADLDGDGHTDVVTANRAPFDSARGPSIAWLQGDGAGGLAPPVVTWLTDASSQPGEKRMVASDFDGDGDPDLAVLDSARQRVDVVRNEGAGALLPGQAIHLPGQPVALAAGDVDGDAHPDLVAARSSGAVSLLRGTGDGTFADGGTFALPPGLRDVAVIDQRIVVSGGRLLHRIAPGGERVETFRAGVHDATGLVAVPNARRLLVVDASNLSVRVVTVGERLAAGPRAHSGWARKTATAIDPKAAFGDLNGDGCEDITIVRLRNYTPGETLASLSLDAWGLAAVSWGQGRGFSPEPLELAGVGYSSVAATDLDGDGRDDLVIGDLEEGVFTVRFPGPVVSQ